MGDFPTNNRITSPTHRINLEKSGSRWEPFAGVTMGSQSGKRGGLRQRDCFGRHRSFPARNLEGGLLPEGPRRVELEGGVDIGPLAGAGVPVFGLAQDGTRYFDLHHTADDTLDKIDPKALAQNVAAYTVFAYLAAEADGSFGSEAKATTPPNE